MSHFTATIVPAGPSAVRVTVYKDGATRMSTEVKGPIAIAVEKAKAKVSADVGSIGPIKWKSTGWMQYTATFSGNEHGGLHGSSRQNPNLKVVYSTAKHADALKLSKHMEQAHGLHNVTERKGSKTSIMVPSAKVKQAKRIAADFKAESASRRTKKNPVSFSKIASKVRSAVRSLTPAGRRAKKALKRVLDYKQTASRRNPSHNPRLTGKGNKHLDVKISRVKIDRQGYDKSGRYWGVGAPLFEWSLYNEATGAEEYGERRASSKADVLAWMKQKYAPVFKRNPRKKAVVRSSKKTVSRRKNSIRKSNPSHAASKMYKKFHGKKSTKVTSHIAREHVHTNLAELGDVKELKVLLNPTAARKHQKLAVIKPSPSQPVKLCSNEAGTQLYFVGGSQVLALKRLGFSAAEQKENMTIGVLEEITYRTKKGFDQFKTIDYYHGLGEESGVKPYLTYQPRNRQLGVSGGRYKIQARGIVD